MSGSARPVIALLAAGGTIAGRDCGGGLSPAMGAEDVAEALRAAAPEADIRARGVLNLDSSEMTPENWRDLAREATCALKDCDAVIITHGTDTMAYTAAALSFMIRNLGNPVVLTGSMLPLDAPGSDAPANLRLAARAALAGIRGVTVAFGGLVINGTRAVKTSTSDFRAFESVGASPLAEMKADGLRIASMSTALTEPGAPVRLDDSLSDRVALIKLAPGSGVALMEAAANAGAKGIVVEAFGAGNAPRGIAEKIRELRARGVVVAVKSQCLRDRVSLSAYGAGRALAEAGAIPTADMTTEAVVAKLMWALGRARGGEPLAETAAMFATCYAGEITIR